MINRRTRRMIATLGARCGSGEPLRIAIHRWLLLNRTTMTNKPPGAKLAPEPCSEVALLTASLV
jgi:hypothetical protein